MEMASILWFVMMGLLGGLAHALVEAKKWSDLKKFRFWKRIALGAVIGLVYNFLYSDWDFPNSVMSFVSGYAGASFIESLTTRLRQKK